MVKLYADEDGADLLLAEQSLFVSALVRVEVPSALWRKRRDGVLGPQATRLLVDDFEADLEGAGSRRVRLMTVPVTRHVLVAAARLVAVHGLRSLDAIQLASALEARAADPGVDTFACFDARLREVGAAEGFRTVPG